MRRLVQGNEAVFLGALKAGANFYAGYPISPSSEILQLASEHTAKHPDEFRFLQSEDELGAANAIIGASLAGAKAFTATAGPGFSLMQEAIGYAHFVEVPVVIVNVQRVGPATGMPTLPAQGDILQARSGTSGDYYPIVFYPNSVLECITTTVHAFNAAEESLSPTIVLTDAFLGHLNELVDPEAVEIELVPRQRPPLGAGMRRFSGILVDETGAAATADEEAYKAWHYRVKKRSEEVAQRYRFYELSGNQASDTLLISYGMVSRVVTPLLQRFAHFRPIRIHPLLAEELREVCGRYDRVVVVEANDGQYASLVEQAIRREVYRVPVLGGRISLDRIEHMMEQVLGAAVH